MKLSKPTLGVIGLGYVGLPLAVTFSKKYSVIGFDISRNRINQLKNGTDTTGEIDSNDLTKSTIFFTHDKSQLDTCDIFILTVPTPINDQKLPDLSLLKSASELVGHYLKPGNLVIYESTVYPGVTEDICIPILEEISNLKINVDFGVGYSPERINPGDKLHTFEKIKKLVSASSKKYESIIFDLYDSVVEAGVYLVSSIQTAEAAKVIENTQRDVNIALMNELSQIFQGLGLNTHEILSAARTKWNFLPFTPGLVGGHCIGIDPYYLIHCAEQIGCQPTLIKNARNINDGMVDYVIAQIDKCLTSDRVYKILIAGITFKENCPDIRNSKVLEIFSRLKSRKNLVITLFDPVADQYQNEHDDIKILQTLDESRFDLILIGARHSVFIDYGIEFFQKRLSQSSWFFDLLSCFEATESDFSL